jgi:hypothetical protein
MMDNCRVVVFEARGGGFIFVPVPGERGRYVRTSYAAALVACPSCEGKVGQPCRGDRGWCGSLHVDRLASAHAVLRKLGAAATLDESRAALREDVLEQDDESAVTVVDLRSML